MKRAVFLDRDGVINEPVLENGRAVAPTVLDDFVFIPGIHQFARALRDAGFSIVVVTNQPDVVYKNLDVNVVDSMHALIRSEIPVDDILACFHADKDNCLCRKPKPGMLFSAARDMDLDLGNSFMIGDTWRDMQAGKAANCRTILLNRDFGITRLEAADVVVRNFGEALLHIRQWPHPVGIREP